MMRSVQNLLCCGVFLALLFALTAARPQSSLTETTQELETMEPQLEDVRGAFYDQSAGSAYQNLDRLQMLLAQYNRPNAYLRSPSLNAFDDLYRMPESKRQVRYRQCYFNPISCFKK